MANCSDAFGTITVRKVGKEFLDYLKAVQGNDEIAYYKLAEVEDFVGIEPDANGDLSFDFSTMGRWNYESNINGYLNGEWFKENEAYFKFMEAIEHKEGSVEISYTDSDPAMDWMGTGVFKIWYGEGEMQTSNEFDEESITVAGYAKLVGEDQYYALEYLYGDEVAGAYDKYVDKCKEDDEEPVDPDTWYGEMYEEG